MSYAIHTVFIAKENILFLEQWIDYHMLLGFNLFYLYDNSKVNLTNDLHNNTYHNKNVIPNKINKYCINYDEIVKLSNDDINNILNQIEKKYEGKVKFIEWSPKNRENKVMYEQRKAHNDCLINLKKDNVKWCAFIDMDEYIVSNNIKQYLDNFANTDVACIQMKCHNMLSRFTLLNEPCINISKGIKELRDAAYKNIINIQYCNHVDVHWCVLNSNKKVHKTNDLFFLHYNLNSDDKHYIPEFDIDLIDSSIKTKINDTYNKKEYIIQKKYIKV